MTSDVITDRKPEATADLDYEDAAWLRKIYISNTERRTRRDKRIVAWLDKLCWERRPSP
jgi:hypothetical protein